MRYSALFLILTGIFCISLFCSCSKSTEPEPTDKEPTVALLSGSSSAVIGEVITADLKVKNIEELAGIGLKLAYDPLKLEVTLMTRDDSWLVSEGGIVQQMEFTSNNDQGYSKIVLAVFPANKAVGDLNDAYHPIAQLRIKALSAGTAGMSISMNNTADSDLGIFKANGSLATGITTKNLSISVSSK
jgi:hypothetical protein